MKAMEAINAIIILILAILAILAVLAFFIGAWAPAKSGVSLEAAARATCQKIYPSLCNNAYLSCRMPVFDFDANQDGLLNNHTRDPASGDVDHFADNFCQLCWRYYNGGWCKRFIEVCMMGLCGCPKPYTYDQPGCT